MAHFKFSLNSFSLENSHQGKLNSMKSILASSNNFKYVLAIPISSIPDFFKHKDNFEYRALGASGAVSAVIFSAILFSPDMPLQFFFIPFNIPGYVFGILFLITSAYLANKGQGNIGHNAHFWGAVFGLAFTYFAAKAISGIDLMQELILLNSTCPIEINFAEELRIAQIQTFKLFVNLHHDVFNTLCK